MRRRLALWVGGALLLLLLSATAAMSIGTVHVPFRHVWGILLHGLTGGGSDGATVPWTTAHEQIIWKVRLPRMVLGCLVGAALALAGAGFQGVLRNPLADPYTLGVSSGASVGAAFLILFGLQYALFGEWTIPAAAFVTGSLTLYAVLALARTGGRLRMETVLLAGVVMQAFLGAIVSFMVAMSDEVINEIIFWMMGSLVMRGWSYSMVLLPYVCLGAAVLMAYGSALNLFALGERQAAHLGVDVERAKLTVLAASTLLTAGAVSVSGVVAFVGLLVPHLLRLLAGPDYRLLLPLSLVGGAVYMLWADTLARTLLSPTEIPLGVVTAFMGAPFFAYLLRRRKQALRE
ncbi:FecCD family ABC transporter permease [Paenibacillus mucilaginosus]|uniref:Cobalamin/Fe3+siderophores ABC transporter permease n=2 Tax=Paenibacillus mucilaginosus TaxID=61624 RepID=H6NGG2_9BACL|nr:iron chelate uptake ABC transporter family permease subunit [Paenibacillus mucilaginosus]AEI45315.1 permease component of ABC-type cobalamin/Fe3+-siderophores transport systems [Paenibacillus mucilaginosus KNP414]AFC33044.1 cobalamin/Fe3+siderophores ABC transporter permease [Paenibacillus mucilaginosus 3016]MCG7212802.1 iron ABC transporter permease [Paenibacillus mucilaginosus]WDM26773.1 iron ABC transporter permease [Paenibacillus mucilaginosus]WFA21483.1 iron ABC transporter permease [P